MTSFWSKLWSCELLGLVLSLAITAPSFPQQKNVGSGSLERRFDALDLLESQAFRVHESTRRTAQLFGEAYSKDFSPLQRHETLVALNGTDLGLLFRAASIAQFYTFDVRYVRDMQLDLAELQKRGGATQGEYGDFYSALIASRRFSQARTFAQTHPGFSIAPIPTFRNLSNGSTAGPTAMILSSDGSELHRRSINLHEPAQIVVISSPLCHFSAGGLRDIDSDGVLHKVFQSHATWLIPPNAATSFEAVEQWNRKHPDERMVMAYRFQEWPMFDRWELPTFYFLRSGRVIAQVVGWPRQGRKREVEDALRRVGLL